MGYWKEEWNKLDEMQKKSFINTFKGPIYILIAIIVLLITANAIGNFLLLNNVLPDFNGMKGM